MARTQLILEVRDNLLAKFERQMAQVGEGKARVAMARAVNYGGARALTQVRSALVRQTSIKRGLINDTVKLQRSPTKPGGTGDISATIYGTGSELPLAEFGPKQFRFGVRARVWGRSQRFPSTFIFAGRWNSGKAIAGQNVFVRTGGKSKSGRNNAFEKVYGPSIPKEMLKDQSKEAFERVAPDATERRLFHELSRLLKF